MIDGPAFPTDRPSSRPAEATAGGGAAAAGGGFRPFGKDGFSFGDLLDIINPLQHIPVVSTIYRKVTGDTLDALPRLAGGTLFGGIAGAVSAVVNLGVKAASGRDIGANALAFVENGLGLSLDGAADDGRPVPPEMIADAPEAAAPAFSAGWQAAVAMQYCDAECLDPKRSFFTDAASIAAATLDAATLDAAATGAASSPAGRTAVETDRAAARYAEATALAAAAAPKLDMHG